MPSDLTHAPVRQCRHSFLYTSPIPCFHSCAPFVCIFPPAAVRRLSPKTSEALQPLPLCLKQEMSPEVTSTSPSPNMAASNLPFVELQALQKSSSVSGGGCGNANHFPNTFSSFSHHAPVYGQFGGQSIMSGNVTASFISTLPSCFRKGSFHVFMIKCFVHDSSGYFLRRVLIRNSIYPHKRCKNSQFWGFFSPKTIL